MSHLIAGIDEALRPGTYVMGASAAKDKAVLVEVARQLGEDFEWRHETPERDPLLWVSDFAISAFCAGGEWQRQCEALIATVIRLER